MIVAMVIVAGLMASPAVALANPASENCEKLGGKLEIVTLGSGGQIGLCHLPNGYISKSGR
jgi:putative hemolysin